MEWWKSYFSEFYYLAAFSMNKNTKKQVDFILNQLDLGANARILDMCCGYGRHSIELAMRGYHVVGVDYSEELINKARAKAEQEGLSNVDFIKNDIRDYDEVDKYNLTISMFVSLGYFDSEEDNAKSLKVLCDSVREGGYLFLDLYNYYKMYSNLESEMKYPGGNVVKTKRTFDQNLNIAHIKKVIVNNRKNCVKEYDMNIRVYTLDELITMCNDNNMKIYKCFGDYDGNPFNYNSENMLVLLKKEFQK